jgi:hypothetical protein
MKDEDSYLQPEHQEEIKMGGARKTETEMLDPIKKETYDP